MLTIRFRDGLFCPILSCDECGSEITDAKIAMYAWFTTDAGGDSELFTLHKSCARQFEDARKLSGGKDYPWLMWEEMIHLPRVLANNTGCNPAQA